MAGFTSLRTLAVQAATRPRDIEKAPGIGPFEQADALRSQVEHLETALATRDVIGQAKGILMERYRITVDEAFERLRTASQHQNRKVRDLADDLARSGVWEDAG